MTKILKIVLISIICLLTFAQAKGTLKIKSNINDAYIYLNGKKKAMIGEGTTSLFLKEGEYLVEIRKTTKDSMYIHKGQKTVFVGNDSISIISIPTKKYILKSKKKTLTLVQKEKQLREFISEYYSNINYKKSWNNLYMVTNKYAKTVSNRKYRLSSRKIKDVSILWASSIEMNKTKDRARINLNLGFLKHNGKTYCSTNTLTFVYTKKWLLDEQIDVKCKPFIYEHKENSSLLRVEYPPYYVKDEYLKIKVTLKSLNGLKKGGVSVSFPTERFNSYFNANKKIIAKDIASTFENTKLYKEKNKIWNKKNKKTQKVEYPLYEGWTNNWGKERSKTLFFSIKPTSGKYLYVFIRSTLIDKKNKEYPNPKYGNKDQQGYSVFQITIPVLLKE